MNMEMIELSVGTVFNTYDNKGNKVKVVVVERKEEECGKCFVFSSNYISCDLMNCSHHKKREDKKDVIFKKLREYELGSIIDTIYQGNKVKVKVIEGGGNMICGVCYFLGKECDDIACQAKDRKDNRDVHFIEIKKNFF